MLHLSARASPVLFELAWEGNLEDAQSLLALPRPLSKNGLMPIHVASFRGHDVFVRALLETGSSAQQEAWPTPKRYARTRKAKELLRCATGGSKEARAELAQFENECQRNPIPAGVLDPLWTRLHGNRCFLGESAQGAAGCTPLHLACDAGHADVVSTLLENGADPRVVVMLDNGPEGYFSWTPMELAREHQSVVSVLQEIIKAHPEASSAQVRNQERYQISFDH